MFAKLLKHDWKSTSSILGILSLCALGAGLVGGGVLRFFIYSVEQMDTGNEGFGVLMVLSMLLLFGLFMALTAYAAGTQIMLFYRYYKSRFTDEGYLTFTLPVSAGHVFWSSYLVILGWMLISTLVVIVSVFAILTLGTLGTEMQMSMQVWKDFFSVFGELFSVIGGEMTVGLIVSVVSVLANIVYYMTAITVGSIIAKKHKLLAAIGVYLGASVVMGMINGVFSSFSVIFAYSFNANAITFLYIMDVLFSLAMAAGGCVLNIYLMKNKLNLP